MVMPVCNKTSNSAPEDSSSISHQPKLEAMEEGQTLNYACPCELDVVICVFREGMGDPEVLTTLLIDSVVLGEHNCNGTQSGPTAAIRVSAETSQTTFFCAKSSDGCAIQRSIGPRPVTTDALNTCTSSTDYCK